MVDAFHDAREFRFKTIVGVNVEVASEQCIEGIIEILPGHFGLAGVKRFQPSLILLLDPGNELADGVGLRRRGSGLWFSLSRGFCWNRRWLRRDCLRRYGLLVLTGRRRCWSFSRECRCGLWGQ